MAYQLLLYAKNQGKKTVFVSLLAPYDLANYREVADAMLAVYNPYDYIKLSEQGHYRGPGMPALTAILGLVRPLLNCLLMFQTHWV